jgi:hypothetical protein
VTRRQAPHLWTIETSAESGRATIVYRPRADAGGTLFERELAYAMPGLRLALASRLKQVLETAAPADRAA